MSDQKRVKAIFERALEFSSSNERDAFLDRQCANDTRLRSEVEGLLEAYEQAGSFLESPPGGAITVDQARAERPNTQIGPYKLLQQIGEGGFGAVYAAEQLTPVRRKVALKIVKPGMDTREVIARFEAERQALAMMDHPNIAHVLGAGTTDRGCPYFVMELVRGVPITEYCDKHNLTTRERLGLFADVCHAVQHAHQKGIIHRDLKPSNILVTLHDGQPVPKVIDFGVSKALNQQLTERTLFTAYGQIIGTPQYMSPEQAEMSGLDIDTRSDVYSLGVLLYELLTGTTPLDGKRLRAAGYAEMQRIIREEEPPRPSTRVSTMGEEATAVARHRSVDAARLRSQLSGELDWIVMKSLEKERSRRYETANLFAQDIECFLRHEAVSACPPSAAYRLRKFARRNRALLTTAAVIGGLLVAVTALNTLLAFRALEAEGLAEQRRQNVRSARETADAARRAEAALREQAVRERDSAIEAEQEAARQRELAVIAERQAEANFRQARQAVDQYLVTIRESPLLADARMQPLREQLLGSARTFYQTVVDKQVADKGPSPDVAAAHYRRGQILEELGDRTGGRRDYQAARGLLEQLAHKEATAELQTELADVCLRLNDFPSAIRWCEAVLDTDANQAPARRILQRTHMATAASQEAAGRMAEAIQSYEQARQALLPLTNAESPAAADLAAQCATQLAVGDLQQRQQQPAAALAAVRNALEAAEKAHALEPQTARYGELVALSQRRAARLLRIVEQADEALSTYRRALATWSKLAFEHPALPGFKADLLRCRQELAAYQRALGRADDAAATERRAEQFLAALPRSLGEDFFQLAVVHARLAAPPEKDEPALPPEEVSQRSDHSTRAVEALAEAVKLGFRPPADLTANPRLSHLAGREDFRRIAASARAPASATEAEGNPADAPDMTAPDLPLRLVLLATLRGVANALRELGQPEEAQATLDQCLTQLDELALEYPENRAALMAERGQTLYASGHVHWQAKQYPRAKQVWERGFELLQQAHAAAGETERKELGRIISQEELDLVNLYGRVGAWQEAARHRSRYIRFDRFATSVWEARHAVLTLVGDAGESYEEVCRYLLDHFRDDDPTHTAWVLALREQDVLDPANLVELASQNEDSTGGGWAGDVLGYCHLRAGAGVEALRRMGLGTWSFYYRALALLQTGDEHGARLLLETGEAAYASLVENWLTGADLLNPQSAYWWEVLRLQIIRAEAWRRIHDQPAVDPWAALLEARGAALVGDEPGSEAAFRAAVDMAPDDPRIWIARAKTRAALQQFEQAESDFARALELEPNNPRWWIARGRFYLERGLDPQADADYQRAAELSSADLDLFLRTGVWAVGPFPAAMNRSFAPEDQAHPSRAVAGQRPNGDTSAESYPWSRIPVTFNGNHWSNVSLDSLTRQAANVSAYALSLVYAPTPRTATLMIASGQHLRVWVNGECVYDNPVSTESFELLDRIPITLRSGRNEILVRISTKIRNCRFLLRLGDSPAERALTAARLMQWREAVAAFEEIPPEQLVLAGHYWAIYSKCLAAAELSEQFDQTVRVEAPYRRYTSSEFGLTELLRAGTMAPTSVRTPEEWLTIAEEAGAPTRHWQKIAKGRGFYRAGAYAQTVNYYKRQPELADDWETLAVTAMAYHQLGQTAAALERLENVNGKFDSWVEARLNGAGFEAAGPMTSAHRWALLTQANRLIREVELQDPPSLQSLQQKIAAELKSIGADLADQDLALLFQPNEPRLWLARARRLAELARWEEAEADFQKATSLMTDDPFLWLAIGQYWLGRDDLAKATDAYARAIEGDRTQAWKHVLDKVLTGNEALFAAVLAARPRDAELWAIRGRQLCEAGRWEEAAEVWQQLVALGQVDEMALYQLALLQSASGNVAGYGDTCRKMLERFSTAETSSATNFAAWACVVGPGALADYTPAVELAQRFTDANVVLPFARVTLGAALLRSGRLEEAVRELMLTEQFNDASETMGQTSPAYTWYLLATAHARQGRADIARQWYEKATSWVTQALAEQEQAARPKWSWNRRLTLELLEREAAEAMQQSAKVGARPR